MTPHPKDFYIVHIHVPGFRSPWATLTDGPADLTEAKEAIYDRFPSEPPLLSEVCVLHIQDDAPARVVTEDVLTDMAAYWEVAA